MMDLLFNIVVMPIQMILEYIFNNVYSISTNISLSILILSFIVFVFTLPLYLKADNLQKEEQEIQEILAPKVQQIKKHYSGDERHLLLQTYYRQMNYHPIMGLRLVLSLLLQIPIFVAAYTFFSNLSILDGMSCGYISNLSLPDELLKIGNWKINLLPIWMTIVNIQAGLIYSKDKSFRENKNLIIMSLIFLVLLYNSPSALVLYWLYNNIFSLLKNILLNVTSHKMLLNWICLVLFIGYYLFARVFNISQIPIVIGLIIFLLMGKFKINNFNYKNLFFISLIGLWLLLGFFIPSNIIGSDFSEFIFINDKPIDILINSLIIFGGLFLFWGSWVYYFSNTTLKKIITIILGLSFLGAVLNFIFIKMPKAILSNTFVFSIDAPNFNNYFIGVEFYVLILITCFSAFLLLLFKNKENIISKFFLVVILTGLILSINNSVKIIVQTSKYEQSKVQTNIFAQKYINLSKTKKNIIVLFLDRAIASFFPTIVKELPELKKQFNGFTYYPNTLSYAPYTVLAYLPILGGYEYTPLELDKRNGIFEKKYTEAQVVLPAIFSNNGWTSRVINRNTFKWEFEHNVSSEEKNILNNYSLYDKFKILTHDISDASNFLNSKIANKTSDLTKKNLIFFNILSVLPAQFRTDFYDNGLYKQIVNKQKQYSKRFLDNYAELLFLPELTEFASQKNTFTVFNNELTHNPVFLSYPQYDIGYLNSDLNYKTLGPENHYHSLIHYHVNILALKLLGKYFDFLRQNDVYDNTRIIIVADHGFGSIHHKKENIFLTQNFFSHNPLLLVKDFNKNAPPVTNDKLMTNADVPFLATQGVISEPINPFTNKKILKIDKEKGILLKVDNNWQPKYYLGKTKVLSENALFHFVKGNPNRQENWIINLGYIDAMRLVNDK